jgi:hypothetical protein
MIELTLEQRLTISNEGETPHRAIDPDTQTAYVLIREEVFARVAALLVEQDDNKFLGDMYCHAMEVFGRDGWDDPAMDIYNDLDPRQKS